MSTTQYAGGAVPDGNLWQDGKRWLWLLSPALPLLSIVLLYAAYRSGIGMFYWGFPIIFYGIVPLMDWLIGTDPINAPDSAVPQLIADQYYRFIVFAYVPSQYLVTIGGAWLWVHGGLAWWELVGLTISVGMVNGIGINTAHELGHKTEKLERWLAKVTLAPVAYGHFFIEHNKGHHKNVATLDDPASSKMGETFWEFLPRTVIGSLRSAWHIERQRLERNGQSVWSTENENLQAWAMTVLFFGALTYLLGPSALVFLVIQAAYGASLLEVVNYLEHYGLLRRFDAKTGRYERCQPHHSWNSNHIVTNLVLYQLQRHSDHHANPTRRYQALRHFDDSPQLPSGYASMILVAYLPPLWFRLMDRRVVEHHRGDIRGANLLPRKREQLLRRWMNESALRVAPEAVSVPASAASAPASTAAAEQCYQCPNCSYVYDPRQGRKADGIAPGTAWERVPADWSCPDCSVRDKVDFVRI